MTGVQTCALPIFIVTGPSNAVNLADGLDGLAAGSSILVFAAYTLVNIWQNSQSCALEAGPKCYEVRDPLDLAVVAAAITGACFGFLWWNASPAQIFMGDTGSLALGGLLGSIAVATKHEIVLAIVGGLFVLEMMSVIIQVASFKLTGKRVFVFADGTHAVAAARIASEELGFSVVGIGTYSPRLDRFGNSVRGVEACSELASRLGLHVFDCLNIGSSFLDTML